MNTIKRPQLFIALAGLAFVMLASGCMDNFLERDPLIGTTEANFYQTEADAIQATVAAYSVLQWDGHLNNAGHFNWFWGDIMSDDAIKGGSGDNDVFSLLQLENFSANASNELVESEWRANYSGIARANIVLDKVPPIEMDENVKQRLLAEAKWIRAYFYFKLVTLFGDVPLITEPLTPENYNQPRTPQAEIWVQIENDLLEAAVELPLRSELPLDEIGRVTKGAANAMLLKSYIWQERWAEAKVVAEDIVNSGQYFLEPDYSSIFTTAGENGSGSIFEIQFQNTSNGDWFRFTEGTLTNVFQRARGVFGGFGFNIPTQDFVDEFEAGDPRLASTVFQVGDLMGDRGEFTLDATGFPHLYYAKKYFLNGSEEAPTGDPNVNGQSNERVIRYADVLLMHAEAAFNVGDEVAARNSLNQVRARARTGTPGALPDRTSSGDALLEHIYHERRVELGLEGHRFFDLVRTGRAGNTLRAQGLDFVDGVHELLPIPASEIAATNGAIIQNPGY